MTATILRFPPRGPFVVSVIRDDEAWLVVCRSHGWLHPNFPSAYQDALYVAKTHGVAVMVEAA